MNILTLPQELNPMPFDADAEIVDVESAICKRLIECGAADGNVYVSDRIQEFVPPAIFVSAMSVTGDGRLGLWETMIAVSCINVSEYDALKLADFARRCLDGWGENKIADVSHVSTIPNRTAETSPVIHTRVMTFRVLHQE